MNIVICVVSIALAIGGDFAFSGTYVYGNADLSPEAGIAIPPVIEDSVELNDDRWTAGVTFNGKNDDTDYRTGTELHLEASVFYQFTPAFSAGINGYHYQQITEDSGQGAELGSFKGRVSALGPGLSGTFQVGPMPVSVSLRYFHEFVEKNRLQGSTTWFTVTIPLWVPPQNR